MTRTLGALALVLLAAGPLVAQDERDWPDPREKKSDLDKQLDDALRREYGERDPLIPPVKRPGEADPSRKPGEPDEKKPDEPPAAPTPPGPKADEGADKVKLTWRFDWSHWNLEVTDLHVGASRHGGNPNASSTIGLADPERSSAEGYALGVDMGEWLSLDGSFRYVVARGGELASRDFDLRGHTFHRDEVIDTKFSFITTDFDLTWKPIHGSLGHLDVIAGVRYVGSWASVSNPGGADHAEQSVEALLPMIGAGGTLHLATEKNVLVCEPYVRVLVGGMRYDAGERLRAFALSAEVGSRWLLADVIGLELGYRYELMHLDRGSDSATRLAHWRAGGMIAGLVLKF